MQSDKLIDVKLIKSINVLIKASMKTKTPLTDEESEAVLELLDFVNSELDVLDKE